MSTSLCRSALYMPASNPRALAKGPTLDADAIIIDLEDAVAPASKVEARGAALAALSGQDYGHRLRALRINGVGTPWHADDLDMAIRAAPDVLVLPKIESAAAVRLISGKLAAHKHEHARCPRLWAMVETPLAVLHAEEIAATPLDALVIGGNDLALAAGLPGRDTRPQMMPWMMTFVAAAKAYGRRVLDGVRNDFSDTDAFRRECEQGHAMGMDGKTLIHPAQIPIANDVWTPDDDAVAEARAVVAAFADPAAAGAGVLRIDGRMVERLHLGIAQRVLACHERLTASRERAVASTGDPVGGERDS